MTSDPAVYWRRNLTVCLFGSFTTIISMTVMLPFLPLYVEELGVHGHAAIVQWSGVAYGAAFFSAALLAPIWGRLSDRFGRKPMLIRASLGIAVTTCLIGFSQSIWHLVGLRFLAGVAGGYSSASTILVAVQTPRERSGWALGMLSSGIMAGNLVGPLIGGTLPPLIGIRQTFLLAGGIVFFAFLATALLLKEAPRTAQMRKAQPRGRWADVECKDIVLAMLATGMLLMFANMSIEPIITVYVRTIVDDPDRVTFVSGLVMSAAALGSILSASRLGKVADRIGHGTVIVGGMMTAAALLIPQGFVTAGWQLIGLRFLMGVALGGLLPCVASVIRHNVPDSGAGMILGYLVSSQFAGQVAGPLVGGFIGGNIGMRAVFFGTSLLMLLGGLFNWRMIHRDRMAREAVA